MERQVGNAYEYAKERFIEDNEELVEEIGEDKVNYSDLYELDMGDKAEELSEMEMDMGDDSIKMSVKAFYYNPSNSRAENNQHTITLIGDVNLEAPYHRSGNMDDYKEITFTFNSKKELEDKMSENMEHIIDWFGGDAYSDSTREMKIRRMAKGGWLENSIFDSKEETLPSYQQYTYKQRFKKGITAKVIGITNSGVKIRVTEENDWNENKLRKPRKRTFALPIRDFMETYKLKYGDNDTSVEQTPFAKGGKMKDWKFKPSDEGWLEGVGYIKILQLLPIDEAYHKERYFYRKMDNGKVAWSYKDKFEKSDDFAFTLREDLDEDYLKSMGYAKGGEIKDYFYDKLEVVKSDKPNEFGDIFYIIRDKKTKKEYVVRERYSIANNLKARGLSLRKGEVDKVLDNAKVVKGLKFFAKGGSTYAEGGEIDSFSEYQVFYNDEEMINVFKDKSSQDAYNVSYLGLLENDELPSVIDEVLNNRRKLSKSESEDLYRKLKGKSGIEIRNVVDGKSTDKRGKKIITPSEFRKILKDLGFKVSFKRNSLGVFAIVKNKEGEELPTIFFGEEHRKKWLPIIELKNKYSIEEDYEKVFFADGGSIKGRNNKSGESFGVVIGSKEFTDDDKERISLNVRSSYSSRISERKLVFDTNGNLIETLDYGYTLDGSNPNKSRGSGRHIGASNKKETIDAMVDLGYNKGFANKVIEFVKE